MGFFLFSGQCLTWIPPLVFTAINESGVSQRVGVAALDVFFILAIIFYLLVGGYEGARREVNRETALRDAGSKSARSLTDPIDSQPDSIVPTNEEEESAAFKAAVRLENGQEP